MKSSEEAKLLSALRLELEFLNRGGYRDHEAWRLPMIFEDSPICTRRPDSSCDKNSCPLWELIRPENRERSTPCRYIHLNDKGETVDSLYRTGTPEELELALRTWLEAKIKELEG